MTLPAPQVVPLDYQTLLSNALARISAHNPEWTNYNHSDPGITLLELFAFLTDSLVYRTNLIPDRNLVKFLNLLGVPLTRASTAVGIVTLSNDHGALQSQTLNGGIEVDAGSVAFHTDLGLDLLPIAAQVFTKQVASPTAAQQAQQAQLYASLSTGSAAAGATQFAPYEPTALDPTGAGVWINQTADQSIWIALTLRASDAQAAGSSPAQLLNLARQQLAGQTLSLGFVPLVDAAPATTLQPAGTVTAPVGTVPLTIGIPIVGADGTVPMNGTVPAPAFQTLQAAWPTTGFTEPGVVQVSLPGSAAQISTWTGIDPFAAGVGDMPPSMPNVDPIVITWLRAYLTGPSQLGVLWMGINAATVSQKTHVSGEVLPPGTGAPDQVVQLAHTPVLPDSVVLSVASGGTTTQWTLIDDITCAPPEIPVRDPRLAPGVVTPPAGSPYVFALDPSTGLISFGDGTHGARPPAMATLSVDYDYGSGSAGNVGAGAISNGIGVPQGVTVTNPVPTWGGADAEAVDEAAAQTARYLQHRDRLVTVDDFEAIVYRTPGVVIGRMEVLPATNPTLSTFTPGSSPGAVTVMVVPSTDPVTPNWPTPDAAFIGAVGAYLDPRRLVTTQLYVVGPQYVPIWISIGLTVQSGQSIADVTAAVSQTLAGYLAAIDPTATPWYEDPPPGIDTPYLNADGWPLNTPVVALALQAVASRVGGVQYVEPVLLAQGSGSAAAQVSLSGLQLPQIAGISVVNGDPIDLDTLRLAGGAGTTGTGGGSSTSGGGTGTGTTGAGAGPTLLPVPNIPDSC